MDMLADTSTDIATDGRWMAFAELAVVRGIHHASGRRVASGDKCGGRMTIGLFASVFPLDKAERQRGNVSADTTAGISRIVNAFDAAIVTSYEQQDRERRRASPGGAGPPAPWCSGSAPGRMPGRTGR
jgi:hypothetical protein